MMHVNGKNGVLISLDQKERLQSVGEKYPRIAKMVRWVANNKALAIAAGILGFVQLVPGAQSPMNAGAAGFIAGGSVGAAVGLRTLSFTGRGPAWQRLARFVVGLLVMLPLMGLMQRLGLPDAGLGRLVLAADLAVLGLWMTLGAPWLFEKLRLSRSTNP